CVRSESDANGERRVMRSIRCSRRTCKLDFWIAQIQQEVREVIEAAVDVIEAQVRHPILPCVQVKRVHVHVPVGAYPEVFNRSRVRSWKRLDDGSVRSITASRNSVPVLIVPCQDFRAVEQDSALTAHAVREG